MRKWWMSFRSFITDKESEVNPVGVTAKRLDVHYHVRGKESSELRIERYVCQPRG